MKPFTVIDNSLESLLQQAEAVAGFIRYYNLNNIPDGYFDAFLKDLRQIREEGIEKFTPDGNLEPAQALLFTFLQQLRDRGDNFNNRWDTFIHWYINEILKVKAPQVRPDATWITFEKNIPDDILIPRGTAFTFNQADSENRILYRLADDITISDVCVEKLYTLNFEHHQNISPAKELGCPTSLHMKNVLEECREGQMLFETSSNLSLMQPLGLQISSSSLLLREGKRIVSLFFEFEAIVLSFQQKRRLVALKRKIADNELRYFGIGRKNASGLLIAKLLSNIFFLEISIAEGWAAIPEYALKSSEEPEKPGLFVKFELSESFPATSACEADVHQVTTKFPALRVLLNRDAWLFPYGWLKNILVSKISINTEVEGLSQILFYNDLGQVDTASPFSPFGINTECRTYFMLGNYEMAVKQSESMELHVRWQQLPDCKGGLASYYEDYENENIDNASFLLSTQLLSNYQWLPTKNQTLHYLFNTDIKDKNERLLPRHKLATHSILKNIALKGTQPVSIPESQYEYNLQAKSGFIRFVLESPLMGFGEKKYRQLFQDKIFEKAVNKKNIRVPNPPVTPLVERMTISYVSHDEIRLSEINMNDRHQLCHIYPFGTVPIYPNRERKSLSFIFSMPNDANLLFGLKNVKGHECVDLYIDFFPQKKEITRNDFPVVLWYIGNGYHWERLPDDTLLKDATQNFVTSGLVKIYIPEVNHNKMRDADGLLWLCAGIVKNQSSVSSIRNVYTNAARVFRYASQTNLMRDNEFEINTSVESIPGVAGIRQITAFSKGMEKEDDKAKLIRVSDYVGHRGKAVTPKDYERLALQHFPEIQKIKCLPFSCKDGNEEKSVVSLVVIPFPANEEEALQPKANAELLLGLESFFKTLTSERVTVDAIHPVYEEILVRCCIIYKRIPHNRAKVRSNIVQAINQRIAPWQSKKAAPDFNNSFTIGELIRQIEKLKLIEKVKTISVFRFTPKESGKFEIREYNMKNEMEAITPASPNGVLIPSKEHIMKNISRQFGVNEMVVNENFVIWPSETGKL